MANRELRAAIRSKCLDCCCQQLKEVRLCPASLCHLWPYRIGRHGPKQETGMAEIVQNGSQVTPEKLQTFKTKVLG